MLRRPLRAARLSHALSVVRLSFLSLSLWSFLVQLLHRPSRAFFLTRSGDLVASEVGDTVGGGLSVWSGLAGVRVLEPV